MDKVELIGGVCPGEGDIVDFKDAIWRNERGLDRGQVDPGDTGGGVLVRRIAAEDFQLATVALVQPSREKTYIAQIPVPVPTSRIS
jgi:hypothetical protein